LATPRFFKNLRRLAAKHGIPFIVDETKTGMGATGKNWAHDYWYLHDEDVPDFVTFGKGGLSGFYSTLEHRLNDEATSFQQQVNLVQLLHYGQIWKSIEQRKYLHTLKDTSSFIKIELDNIARETGTISPVRGYGTHLAFDSDHSHVLHRWLLKSGINIQMCGPKTFALRPALTLNCYDAAQLRESLKYYSPNHE
jgi:4-aminobutyrate aminotransferase/(S)-3-amino-2-methylpropionate transaminase